MARGQGAALDRKKLMADPIMVTTIVVLITFLTLFILYPLAILLVDSFVGDGSFGLSIFKRIFAISQSAVDYFRDRMHYDPLPRSVLPAARLQALESSGRASAVFGREL